MLKNMTPKKQKTKNLMIDLKYKNESIKTIRVGDYKGVHEPIEHTCYNCGKSWIVQPSSVMKGGNCKKCWTQQQQVGSSKFTHVDYLNELKAKNIKTYPISKFINKSSKIYHICYDCKTLWYISPNAVLKSKYGIVTLVSLSTIV